MKKFLLTLLVLILITPQTIKAEETINIDNLFMYSSNYVLIDQDTSEILIAHNSKERVHPASITKALTLITALEMLEGTDLKTKYIAPQEAYDGLTSIASIADFQPGDSMSLDDYLYGIMLPSGADATRIISMYLTKEPEGLIDEMNAMAKKIGMNDSNFVNTSGLDEDNHYATVEDLARLIQYALKNEDFKRYYTTVEHTTSPTEKYPDGIEFENYYLVGALERDFKELYGAKSGYTELAERALSSVATNGTMNLIFVSTNAPREEKVDTNLLDAINVYKEVFNNYKKFPLQKKDEAIIEFDILKRSAPYPIIAKKDLVQYIDKDLTLEGAVKVDFKPIEGLSAPIAKDSVLGTLTYSVNNEILFSEVIIADNDIGISFRYQLLNFSKVVLTLVLSLVILALIAILIIRNYRLYKIRQRRKAMGWVRRKK